jgi:hypothetical protein
VRHLHKTLLGKGKSSYSTSKCEMAVSISRKPFERNRIKMLLSNFPKEPFCFGVRSQVEMCKRRMNR